jgi:hypothetical protein
MWEPSCYVCGVLAGPTFNVMLQRYNTEEEAFAAANSILSMLPDSSIQNLELHRMAADVMGTSEERPSRREQVLMDSQKAWLRRLERDLLWIIFTGIAMVISCLFIIEKSIGWSFYAIVLTGMVCTVPLFALLLKTTVERRIEEVEKQ